MTKTAIALPLCLMAALHAPVAKAGDLPAQRDIPADLSTVICPDADSARVMLTDYFALDTRGIFDTCLLYTSPLFAALPRRRPAPWVTPALACIARPSPTA